MELRPGKELVLRCSEDDMDPGVYAGVAVSHVGQPPKRPSPPPRLLPPPDLRDQLQTSLGTAYTLVRELGGGGMLRVFLATETALGRAVVVKVLPPDMAASVSIERFKRGCGGCEPRRRRHLALDTGVAHSIRRPAFGECVARRHRPHHPE